MPVVIDSRQENQDNQRNERPNTRNSGPFVPTRISLRTAVLNTRAQIFEVFFRRVALGYARVFPLTARRIIEFGFLVQAVFVLAVFTHLHMTFVRSPVTCLDHLRSDFEGTKLSLGLPDYTSNTKLDELGQTEMRKESWPRYGILRIEVIRSPDPDYSLADSYRKEFYGIDSDYFGNENDMATSDLDDPNMVLPKTPYQYHLLKFVTNLMPETLHLWNYFLSLPHLIHAYVRENLANLAELMSSYYSSGSATIAETEELLKTVTKSPKGLVSKCVSILSAVAADLLSPLVQFFRDVSSRFYNLFGPVLSEDNYIIEYALEYGFLRLSPQMRKRLNITVKLVVLDPETNPCFGSLFSRFLMEEFLGYEDLLFGSIKYLSTSEGVKGYVGNVISGQHYRLVVSQMSRSSYLAAALIMVLFTFCVSILLRYSSQQLVVVIADILQMFETNAPFRIPVAPFMTVILALVAMETIMSEFFGDSITAFYVILIVSVCDHYEAVFCRTDISLRYWPKFFYVYHFAFYAYHYRFNGQFSGVALWVSWLFILHSMIYFFHHYELPNLLSGWEVREILNNIHMEDPFESETTPFVTAVEYVPPTIVLSPQHSASSSSLPSEISPPVAPPPPDSAIEPVGDVVASESISQAAACSLYESESTDQPPPPPSSPEEALQSSESLCQDVVDPIAE